MIVERAVSLIQDAAMQATISLRPGLTAPTRILWTNTVPETDKATTPSFVIQIC